VLLVAATPLGLGLGLSFDTGADTEAAVDLTGDKLGVGSRSRWMRLTCDQSLTNVGLGSRRAVLASGLDSSTGRGRLRPDELTDGGIDANLFEVTGGRSRKLYFQPATMADADSEVLSEREQAAAALSTPGSVYSSSSLVGLAGTCCCNGRGLSSSMTSSRQR
jgi:hypothetical protein